MSKAYKGLCQKVVVFTLLFFCSIFTMNISANDSEKEGYRLIFHDEFNGESQLDQSKWVTEFAPGWTKYPERAITKYDMLDTNGDGISDILSLKTNDPNDPVDPSFPWCPTFDGQSAVSAIMTAKRNEQQKIDESIYVQNPSDMKVTNLTQYGYFELRAKGQPGSGRHVAWWLTGFDDEPEHSTEIDIFEIRGILPRSTTSNTHRWYDPDGPDGNEKCHTDLSKSFVDEFHTWGFDWIQDAPLDGKPDRMVIYLDGAKIDEFGVNVDYPMMSQLSLHENRSATGWTGPWVWKPYPNTFQIDYYRIYKKLPQGHNPVANEDLAITNIQGASMNVHKNDVYRKQFTSQVEGHVGELYTEPNIVGTPSYVEVTWNDGTMTHEWVIWEPITDEELYRMNILGESITKSGTIQNVDSTTPGYVQATLTVNVTEGAPYSTNLGHNEHIGKLFDKNVTSDSWESQTLKKLPPNGFILREFEEVKDITAINFATNYGLKQGIEAFEVEYWNADNGQWVKDNRTYTIPWTEEGNGEMAESIIVRLQETISTSMVRIHVKRAPLNWGKIVLTEMDFIEGDIPVIMTNLGNAEQIMKIMDGYTTAQSWSTSLSNFPSDAHITFEYNQNKRIKAVVLSTNYGLEQGIQTFDISYWDNTTNQWVLDNNMRNYSVPWTSYGNTELGESIVINLNAPIESERFKIHIKSVHNRWNKLVLTELKFVDDDSPINVSTNLNNASQLYRIIDGNIEGHSWNSNMNAVPAGAYILMEFADNRAIDELSFTTSYGLGQGIKKFNLQYWDEESSTWRAYSEHMNYTIPWTTEGNQELGESIIVPLRKQIITKKIKIMITEAYLQWGHLVVTEITPYEGVPKISTNLGNSTQIRKVYDGNLITNSWYAYMSALPANAYVAFDFPEVRSIDTLAFATSYGGGQGIRNIEIQYYDQVTSAWISAGSYDIPWTDRGNNTQGEQVIVNLNQRITTRSLIIKVKSANLQWGKLVISEINIH